MSQEFNINRFLCKLVCINNSHILGNSVFSCILVFKAIEYVSIRFNAENWYVLIRSCVYRNSKYIDTFFCLRILISVDNFLYTEFNMH